MYYRGANAALLLYDITNASSFEDVRGWLEGMSVLACCAQPSLSVPERIDTDVRDLRAQEELLPGLDYLYRRCKG